MANRIFADDTCELPPVSWISRMISIALKIFVAIEKDPRDLEEIKGKLLARAIVQIYKTYI